MNPVFLAQINDRTTITWLESTEQPVTLTWNGHTSMLHSTLWIKFCNYSQVFHFCYTSKYLQILIILYTTELIKELGTVCTAIISNHNFQDGPGLLFCGLCYQYHNHVGGCRSVFSKDVQHIDFQQTILYITRLASTDAQNLYSSCSWAYNDPKTFISTPLSFHRLCFHSCF